MNTLRNFVISILCLMAGSFSYVHATTADGTLGATSTGTVDINVILGNMALIKNLNLITFTTNVPVDETKSETFCIYTNGVTGYKLTVSSNGSAYELIHSTNSAQKIAYTLNFFENTTGGTAATLTHATETTSFIGTTYNDATCATDNVRIEASITNAAASGKETGSYSDTITILVTPTV